MFCDVNLLFFLICSLSCDEFPILGQTDRRFRLTFVWPGTGVLSKHSECVSAGIRYRGCLCVYARLGWPLTPEVTAGQSRTWPACWFPLSKHVWPLLVASHLDRSTVDMRSKVRWTLLLTDALLHHFREETGFHHLTGLNKQHILFYTKVNILWIYFHEYIFIFIICTYIIIILYHLLLYMIVIYIIIHIY